MAERICTFSGCTTRYYCRGYCIKHYRRWKDHGDAGREPVRMPTLCTIDGCSEPTIARGWCHRHYWRWRNFGSPTGVGPERGPYSLSKQDRFWRYVQKSETCWLWTGATSGEDGYGRFNAGTTVSAHRYAWLITGHELHPPLELDHLCRVRLCVNPAHLEEVTRELNTARRDEAQGWGATG